MKTPFSFMHNQADGVLKNKLMVIALLGIVFLGISISPVTALDQVEQIELIPGPISELPDDQFLPSVAFASQINEYLVVWEEVVRVDDYDIYAIRVDSAGNPIGSEISIAISANMEMHPGVAYSPMVNEYLVVWEYA